MKRDLATSVRHGLAWSMLTNLALRAGTFALGIVLARLLVPEQFGVYAVALTVQSVLVACADLGLGADLVRSKDPDSRAPTVAVLALAWGVLLASLMVATAEPFANAFGAADAAPVIALLSVTVVLAGAGVVPYAYLQRRFDQRALFIVTGVDFVVSTTVTLALLDAGHGVMSLAWGRVVAQTVVLPLLFRMASVRPRLAVSRGVAASVLRFGVPVAGANVLSLVVLNLDNLVIAQGASTVALGFYVLAFNISSWPMTAVGQVVRSISLPLFSRLGTSGRGDQSLAQTIGLTWSLALPVGAGLAALATPVIALLYGSTWLPAASMLAALAVFGVIRVVFDLMASYLLARGASGHLLAIQLTWLAVLVPSLVVAVRQWGAVGAAWGQPVVAAVVVLPLYLVAAARAGAAIRPVLARLWPPLLAVLPAWALGWVAAQTIGNDLLALLAGGTAGAACYALLAGRWVLRERAGLVRAMASAPTPSSGRHNEMRTAESDLPTVSVVIPCHDYETFVPQAIESALTQSGVDVEVIVVDDASSDNSASVAEAFADRDSRVRVIRKCANSGPVETFNLGVEHAGHEFLVRLDADDLLTPGSLSRAVEVFRQEPTVGLVYGHPVHFTVEPPKARERLAGWIVWPGATWLADRCLSGVNVITSPEVVMRMSTVRQVGGQRDLAHTHDMEMWMRMATVADVAYVCGADQAWHREHPSSLSTKAEDALGLTILRERRAAFDLVFTSPVPGVEPNRTLAATARRTLAREALGRAAYEYDRRRAPGRSVTPLVAFALETDPDVRRSPEWRRLEPRLDAGDQWARRRPWLLLRPVRRMAVDARRHRTWERTGLYSRLENARRVSMPSASP